MGCVFLVSLLSGLMAVAGPREDSLVVMFWNLENMFDYRDSGTGESDEEFSSFGQRRWTKGRFYAKCNAVAKAIFLIADARGRLPDAVGFAEVENSFVAHSIIRSTALRRCSYKAIHYDSPDRRGIDVAMIYRDDVFEKVSSRPCRIYNPDSTLMGTRDILCATLRHRATGERMHFLVNHHPSKYSGTEASEGKRRAAMEALRGVCDSIFRAESPEACIVAMGDFNDTPSAGLFHILCGSAGGSRSPCAMVNLGEKVHGRRAGTIRYAGKWELIDMFLVPEHMTGRTSGMEIVRIPFLMTRDNTHVGEKPLRTYSGPRYLGGVSDHCPIILPLGLPSAASAAQGRH